MTQKNKKHHDARTNTINTKVIWFSVPSWKTFELMFLEILAVTACRGCDSGVAEVGRFDTPLSTCQSALGQESEPHFAPGCKVPLMAAAAIGECV